MATRRLMDLSVSHRGAACCSVGTRSQFRSMQDCPRDRERPCGGSSSLAKSPSGLSAGDNSVERQSERRSSHRPGRQRVAPKREDRVAGTKAQEGHSTQRASHIALEQCRSVYVGTAAKGTCPLRPTVAKAAYERCSRSKRQSGSHANRPRRLAETARARDCRTLPLSRPTRLAPVLRSDTRLGDVSPSTRPPPLLAIIRTAANCQRRHRRERRTRRYLGVPVRRPINLRSGAGRRDPSSFRA